MHGTSKVVQAGWGKAQGYCGATFLYFYSRNLEAREAVPDSPTAMPRLLGIEVPTGAT